MRGIAKAACISVLIALGACDVGVYGATDGGGGGGGGGGSDTGGSNCVPLVSPPAAMHTHAAGGTSNAGMSCLGAGCHGPTTPGTTQSAFAGTIYSDNTGATPLTGATISVAEGGSTVTAVSDAAGNFYYQTTPTLTYPAMTSVTSCPSALAMATSITMTSPATTGVDCNGCHNVKSPAVPTAPATYVLYQ